MLVREDGAFLYTLPSVADDIDMAITHVVRGEDHVTNTAAQIEIFDALGGPRPHFAHHPLLVGAGGEALSKRLGSLSLQQLREDGFDPLAVAAYLAKIGTSDTVEPRLSLADLAADFDFGKIGRAPAHFDSEELAALNAKTLHQLSYDAVVARIPGIDAALWDAIRPNLTKLSDARDLAALVNPVRSAPGDPEDVPRSPPRPPNCCRPSLGTKRLGRPGPKRWPPPPGPRAGAFTIRCAWL